MLVVLFHSATDANTPLVHVVVSLVATFAGGAFNPTAGTNTVLALRQLALCGGSL